MRHDGRRTDELRPLKAQLEFVSSAPGSVLIQAGRTTVLCTASIEETVPPWKMAAEGPTPSGWLTAEYAMLPGSTSPRKRREREKLDGRSTEIQRLIGRSLRQAVDLEALAGRTVYIDCDVLQADGGTRTASITGGFMALCLAVTRHQVLSQLERPVITRSIAAVSVGVIAGQALIDLDYVEDSQAEVDFNVVMTGQGEFVEVQGTAERAPFSPQLLQDQLQLARQAISHLSAWQREVLGTAWPSHLMLASS
ncbi:MAG: ribonuclease PH [Planctomycetaceae bacterium]|nr:MAG: ribonuclease PH [Planctomycetaceae bacterium]